MQYLITFLEGVLSFLSPCMLPMLPLYISYFAAGTDQKKPVFFRALAFVVGFGLTFSLMGLFAGTLGAALIRWRTAVNLICGALVIVFGLSFLGVLPLNFFSGIRGQHDAGSVVSAFLFGLVYSVSLTPCVGAFLGSALMMAATEANAVRGVVLLTLYAAGMGIPFILSAILIDRLRSAFSWIKANYRWIEIVCGVFLILVGICMALGWMNRLLSLFS